MPHKQLQARSGRIHSLSTGRQESIETISDRELEGDRQRAARRVTEFVLEPDDVLEDIERQVHLGVLDVADLAAVESAFFSVLLAHEKLAEVTLTFSRESGRGQLSVFRTLETGLVTRHVHLVDGRFVADVRDRPSRTSIAF